MERNARLYLWLNLATGPNVTLFEQMIARFDDLEEAYALAAAGKSSAFKPLGAPFIAKLIATANEWLLDEKEEWLEAHNIKAVPRFSDQYPALLKEIRDPPSMLYVLGNLLPMPKLPLAIVGMRRFTSYGEGVATHLAGEFVRHGACIISGMALGIDSAAAKGALNVKEAIYPTVAVLGCGVDVIYPPSNARLYAQIIERGAVISEFLPGTPPLREYFPIRNRVISGLSTGVVVVEAASRSGTTITANYALEQGRDVFAVPGRITDASSVGPNGMIQRGEAKPIFCAADVLCEYGIGATANKLAEPPDTSKLSGIEKRIVHVLVQGEKSADDLCEILSLSIAEINSTLTSLQFSGIIKQLPGRMFGL